MRCRSASAVAESAGSVAAIAFSTRAAARTLRGICPGVSVLWPIGAAWVRLTRRAVGLKPTMPLTAAGQVIEPSVSVPIAAGTNPADTATALPDEERSEERRVGKE